MLLKKRKFKVYNKYLHGSEYIGQIESTFLMFSSLRGIVIVDQHAAHEQILFEQHIKKYESDRKSNTFIRVDRLYKSSVSNRLCLIVRDNLKLISDIGFIVTIGKKNTICLEYYLSCYEGCSLNQFLDIFIREYNNAKYYGIIKYNFIKSYSQQKACHSSWRSGSLITKKYAYQIRDNLNQLMNNSYCPHGRPIMYFMDMADIMKYFLRKKYSSPIDI